MNPAWVTNDPESALALRLADKQYEADLALAYDLPLQQTVEALRAARAKRQAAYDKVRKGE